jgi:hypothetical protein
MSAYPPPTQILSLFNPLYFETDDVDITVGYLDTNYLKFPIAQGLENLQQTNITDATQSTSVSTGSLVTAGGVGIAKQTHIGGQLHCTSTATSTSTTTGCIRANGGVGVAENINVGGTTTSTGLITATGGLTTGAGSVLTSTGTTTLTGATTATGLITANGGLTAGGLTSITVPNNGTSSYYSGTAGSGANIRFFGVSPTSAFLDYYNVLSFRTANSTGGIVHSNPVVLESTGVLTSNNGITANGGLTMGGANNITLGAGTTAPTSGQLGYRITGTISSASITAGSETTVSTITLTPGVWILTAGIRATTNQTVTTPADVLSTWILLQVGTGSQYSFGGLARSPTFMFYNSVSMTYIVTSGTQAVNLIFNPNVTTTIDTTTGLSYYYAIRIA